METVSERISIKLIDDLKFIPRHFLTTWSDGGYIARKSALDLWQFVKNAVADWTCLGASLGGPMGVGKSTTMNYIVHKARKEGWLAIYIPRCAEWVRIGDPDNAASYSYLFDAVLTGLKYVKSEKVRTTYEFCIPPNNYASWTQAMDHTLENFQRLFIRLRRELLIEVEVPVLLAFDESQALFQNGMNVRVKAPFSLIDCVSSYKRGCVVATATADFPCRDLLFREYEMEILNVECLMDDEFALWIQTVQFDRILNHPEYNLEWLPEISSVTGNIPRELVMLNKICYVHSKSLSHLLKMYCSSRQAAYEKRYQGMNKKNPDNVRSYVKALAKFFTQVEIKALDIPEEFFDTSLAYISGDSVIPLNSNALNCFFKLLTNLDEKALEHEIVNEVQGLTSDLPSRVGYAFEKLFGLNLLYNGGNIALKYQSISGTSKQERIIQIRHFLTLDTNKPRKSWEDYPFGTLVAHSEIGEARMDFIYFGGCDCVLFFELTVAKDVRTKKYPKLKGGSRFKLILSKMQKWFGHEIVVGSQELMPLSDYKGAVEYIVVSSGLPD
jgi:Mitochondrial ribosomal death-associated protein 3